MLCESSDCRKLQVRPASARDRRAIYRRRHDVYAVELHQHHPNPRRRLRDQLDSFNEYLVAVRGHRLQGFVSITPPGSSAFSLEKYLPRTAWPVPADDGTCEIRLLTVRNGARRGLIAAALMLGALRWALRHGATQVIVMGRRALVPMYRKAGLRSQAISIRSGAVDYEVMSARIDDLLAAVQRRSKLVARLDRLVDWDSSSVAPASPAPPCYHGGAFFDAIGDGFDDLNRRHAIINADVLDAWFDPSPRVVAALRDELPWLMRTSPPTHCDGMLNAISKARGVPRDTLLPAAGSSAAMFLALPRWIDRHARVLILDPMYGEYAHILERVIGCRVERLVLQRRDNYDVPLEALRLRVREEFDAVILVNPNSPTGRLIPRENLWRIIAEVPRSTLLWVDETYIDFAGSGESVETLAATRDNLVVCKSLSKVYALSGMRAAYLCGHPARIASLRPFVPPWAVSLPAQLAVVRALEDLSYYEQRWRATHDLREQLAQSLQGFPDVFITSGVTNSVLLHLGQSHAPASKITEECRKSGLFARDASAMGRSLGDRVLRIAVKDRETNVRSAAILAKLLSGPNE